MILPLYRLFQINTHVPFPSTSIDSLWSCNIGYRETLRVFTRRISHMWRKSSCNICCRRQGDFIEETWSFSDDIFYEAHAVQHLMWESRGERAQDFSLPSFCLWRGVLPFHLLSHLQRQGCEMQYFPDIHHITVFWKSNIADFPILNQITRIIIIFEGHYYYL